MANIRDVISSVRRPREFSPSMLAKYAHHGSKIYWQSLRESCTENGRATKIASARWPVPTGLIRFLCREAARRAATALRLASVPTLALARSSQALRRAALAMAKDPSEKNEMSMTLTNQLSLQSEFPHAQKATNFREGRARRKK